MGIELPDCLRMSAFLGLRSITNPGIAFIPLANIIKNRNVFEEYSQSYNDSYWIKQDMILPQWNQTLTGGVFSVSMVEQNIN